MLLLSSICLPDKRVSSPGLISNGSSRMGVSVEVSYHPSRANRIRCTAGNTPLRSSSTVSWKGRNGSSRARRDLVLTKVASGKKVASEDKQLTQDDYAEGCAVRMGKVERVKPGSLGSLMVSNFDLELGGIADWLKEGVSGLGTRLTGKRPESSALPLPSCFGFVLDDDM
eukprot:2591413-Pyramimonas_sp.AAC.1